MHAFAFALKRAFHATLNLTRHPLRCVGITAARLDMLHAIHRGGARGLPQRDLRESLGVSAPTISRMLRSLVELRYVTRERHAFDARKVVLRLTRLGLFVLRRALATVGRGLELAYDAALTNGRPWDEAEALGAMDCADSYLARVRGSFRDRATLFYAWRPDD